MKNHPAANRRRARPVAISQRAFTLIEVMLAASLGALVLVACLGVYGALQRSDKVLGERFDHTGQIANVRLVISRMMSSLAMSDEQRPPQGEEAGKRVAEGKKEAEALAKNAEEGKDSKRDGAEGGDPLKYRPRLALTSDSSKGVSGVLRRASIAGSGGDAPQRLEIVSMRSPLPANFGQSLSPKMYQGAMQQQEAERRSLTGELPPSFTLPMRMALELRPDRMTRWIDDRPRGDGEGWTLWWRPLPSDPRVPLPTDPVDDANAVPLAQGLASCHWRVFQKNQFKDDFAAVWWQDLPAYLEMELETVAGVKASWLFEVEWVNMKEGKGEESGDESGSADEGEGAGLLSGGSTRGGGRTGGASPSGSGRGSVRPQGSSPPRDTKRISPPRDRVRSAAPGAGGTTRSGTGTGGGGRR